MKQIKVFWSLRGATWDAVQEYINAGNDFEVQETSGYEIGDWQEVDA